MNVTKTQAMVLSRKKSRPQADSINITLHGETIRQQETVKYLGVVVDQNMNWVQQVEEVRRKSLAGLASIRRASAYLPSCTMRLLYNVIILPHLDYCSVVWHSCTKALSNRVERVQHYAMRMILKKPHRADSERLRNQLGWMTLHRRRQKAMLCQVHSCMRQRAPVYLSRKFITNTEFGYSGTRGENKLHLRRPNTNSYRSTFEFQGAKSFNSLPTSIRSISNANTFKFALAANNLP